MALNGKYISLKAIISDLYGDNGFQDSEVVEDFIRWTVEALKLIGHPLQYRRRVTGFGDTPNLKIENFRAPIPCNIYKIEQIAVNGHPARYSSSSFHHLLGGDCCGAENTTSHSGGPVSGGFYIDGFGNEFVAGAFNSGVPCGITYDLNSDCITLSVKTGEVCIAYLEFPFDEDGYPLIPDEVSYLLAVKKYITMKVDYRNWRKDASSQGKRILYKDSQTEWEFYVGQAGNKAKMPSLDQMESLKNSLVRTFKSFNQHGKGFKGLGEQQRRNIQ